MVQSVTHPRRSVIVIAALSSVILLIQPGGVTAETTPASAASSSAKGGGRFMAPPFEADDPGPGSCNRLQGLIALSTASCTVSASGIAQTGAERSAGSVRIDAGGGGFMTAGGGLELVAKDVVRKPVASITYTFTIHVNSASAFASVGGPGTNPGALGIQPIGFCGNPLVGCNVALASVGVTGWAAHDACLCDAADDRELVKAYVSPPTAGTTSPPESSNMDSQTLVMTVTITNQGGGTIPVGTVSLFARLRAMAYVSADIPNTNTASFSADVAYTSVVRS